MSSLDKLGIRGIRAFDTNELNVIQFYHPLTVIVGHNGSGKTTIIECLKYITTGDMPPNTRGGAFVHDPNMAGESEVKAEVKLRFSNTNNDRMTATRRLQVTKKKTTLSLKTLEATIAYTNDEEDKTKRRALSSRCADLDEEIPRLLGVSKAILENVIFCHQEESNWPLSEPGVLKKKFDDIFEATKYTKALDQIKSIRKDQAAELKVDRERLIALKTDRDRATKVEGTIAKLERDIATKSIDKERVGEEVYEVTKHVKRFYEMGVEHNRILNEVQLLESKKLNSQEALRDLRKTFKEIRGSLQDLQKQRDNFGNDIKSKQTQKQGYIRDIDAAEEDVLQTQKRLQRLNAERGGYSADLQRFEQALSDRDSTVKTLALQFDIKGFDVDPLEEAQIAEFEDRLSTQLQIRKRELEDLRENGKKASDEKRSIISNLESDQRALRSTREDLRRQQTRLGTRLDELILQIDNSRNSETGVVTFRSTIADLQQRQRKLSDDLRAKELDKALQNDRTKLRGLENNRNGLHTELSGLNRQADTRAKLALKRTDLTKKDESVTSLIKTNLESFKKRTGEEPRRERMLEHVKTQISTTADEIGRVERASAAAQRDLNQVESLLTLLKQQKTAAEKEAAGIEAKIEEETEGQELSKAIEEAELEIKTRRTSIEQLKSAVLFYERVLDFGHKKDVCVACSRPLLPDDMANFDSYVKKQIASNPKKIKEEEADLPQWQAILNGLRKLEPLAGNLKKLRNETIPKHEEDFERANTRHQGVVARAEEASAKVADLKSTMRELESLKLVAGDVHRLNNEMQELENEIKHLERQLEASGSARTADDVQAELEKLGNEIDQVKRDIETQQRDKDTMLEKLRACEAEIHSATLSLKGAEGKAEVRKAAIKAKSDVEAEKTQLQERIEGIAKTVQETEPGIQKNKRELKDLEEEQRHKETTANNTHNTIYRGHEELERAMHAVRRGRQVDVKGKLRKCDAEIKDFSAQEKEQQNRVSELRTNISQIEREENEAATNQRNVLDNIRARELQEAIAGYESEIASKDIEGANKAKEHFDKHYRASSQKLSDLQAQFARVGGEVALMEANLAERKAEIDTEYRDVRKLYTRQLIKVKTADFAIQDLEKYGKALDNAIMKYHGHKMMEINDTAQALWNKCYQGTDIDTIMIKSDSEGATKVGNRSYNYRVVMVKDQVELDMRGRCSAGQKVLASIIIRLALAESFGTNCGILALDEPTTNLDKDNIAALAGALADIIRERRQQSNFQLIVITHDEEFLTALGTSGAIDKYWRVSRNHRQKSTIERQRLDQH